MTTEITQENVTNNNIDPQDYFNYIKSKKTVCTDEFLTNLYSVVLKQLQKAMATKQNLVVRRLHFMTQVIEKERELIKNGVEVFVLREDITDFIKNVAKKRVKIVELEFFPREIPDEIVEKIAMYNEKKLFDNYYVVFTDYTGKIAEETQKEVKKEEIRRDPIIFGTFEQVLDNGVDICDRFYYIGDWEDEYCDLTLTKMVQKMSEAGKGDIVCNVSLPEATEETVREYINKLDEEKDRLVLSRRREVKKSFFSNVKTAWNYLFGKEVR